MIKAPTANQHAFAMVLKPKEEFKSWLKKATLSMQNSPIIVDKAVTKKVLEHHAVTFLTPLLSTQELTNTFLDDNCELIFNTLLATWNFSPDAWPTDRTRKSLMELFDVSYYTLIDIASLIEAKERLVLTVTPIKPKQLFHEWIQTLDTTNKLISDLKELDINIFKKFGVAVVTPDFKSNEEERKFIRDNYKTIFETQLSLISEDQSTWPQDLSYKTFIQWFDCTTCYPVIDLI